jgi:hypothetical protein
LFVLPYSALRGFSFAIGASLSASHRSSIEEEDEDQIARQEQQWDQQEEDEDQEERRWRGVELGRPRMPEPMGLGMTHLPLEDDKDLSGSQVL